MSHSEAFNTLKSWISSGVSASALMLPVLLRDDEEIIHKVTGELELYCKSQQIN